MSPLLAMRAAILGRLRGDAGLAASMGGAVRLYDEPPATAVPVYAVFGNGEARDDSVDGARRHLHTLALVIFGRPRSTRSALDATERIAALLDDAALTLSGHALITLRVESIAAHRDARSGETQATLTLKAVTEVVGG
ncbi:DUF3168 domain-containing protein [Methylobacterium haplocladii]|uniref:DUF3168 domain-containing protein n=1 Tax=Methylobacterium haplocladii TaxID=1176176 RepID=A0A512IKR4_9HYPH|nr:DUF3168 domain-containing protein [Methylobacterium haplocladii]GEO98323.1 hypothetical protein MHA02_07110 [Methylobacterium haplocladii]GJD82951.1 hypothetical protein HPGCJGGD_0813 [Methylobacterium haplocladii]GLS61572.1 hypothetical protein GCM10007887_42990 [Methylobacterium haplocladii]